MKPKTQKYEVIPEDKVLSVYKNIVSNFKDFKYLNFDLILEITTFSMDLVSSWKTTGENKKVFVLQIIKKIINESTLLNDDERQELINFTTNILPKTIDMMILAAKRTFMFSKKYSKRCYKSCLH